VDGQRTEIRVGDEPVPLTNGSLILLLRLIVGRATEPKGWVDREELGASDDHGWAGMKRFKQDLRKKLVTPPDLVENDKGGKYRLRPSVAITKVDYDALGEHWDARVRELSAMLREKLVHVAA